MVTPEDPALVDAIEQHAARPDVTAFDAAVFDMDGLLVDSEVLWHQAELEILVPLGAPIDRCSGAGDEGHLRRARSSPTTTADRRVDAPTCEMWSDRILDRVGDARRGEGRLLPGALRALDMCRPARPSRARELDADDADHADAGALRPRRRVRCRHSAEDEAYGKPASRRLPHGGPAPRRRSPVPASSSRTPRRASARRCRADGLRRGARRRGSRTIPRSGSRRSSSRRSTTSTRPGCARALPKTPGPRDPTPAFAVASRVERGRTMADHCTTTHVPDSDLRVLPTGSSRSTRDAIRRSRRRSGSRASTTCSRRSRASATRRTPRSRGRRWSSSRPSSRRRRRPRSRSP